MITDTIHAELKALREDFGGYISYVFQNLDTGNYEMMVRLPRWEVPIIAVGDVGYVKYKEVEAGKDQWFDNNDQKMNYYKYTNVYFINFVADKPKVAEITL